MLPIGLSDVPGEAMVKLYCPKCMDVYTPKSSRYINGNFLAKCLTNNLGTTTLMEPILGQDSLTCFSWCIQSIGQSNQQTK